MPSKNKFGKFWVLGCVAKHAKYLDICRISSKAGRSAVRFNVVSLQIFLSATFFALAAFFYDLRNSFAAAVFAFAGSTIPFVMGIPAHFSTSGNGQAGYRTILAGTASSFPYLKLLPTFLARTLQHRFWFAWPKFLGTIFRTGMRFAPNMRVWSAKNVATTRTRKYSTSAPFNFSLEFGHG